jgi:dienelactone hydrolase
MSLRRLVAALFALTLVAQAQSDVTAWRSAIRHTYYVPDKLPALHSRVWSTFSPTPGVVADRITYSTADGMIVPAIVYRPEPKLIPHGAKLPGIVIVNGHGSDKFGWYAFYSGILFAKAGAVALTYDPIGEGERNAQRLSRQSPSPHDADVTPPAPLPHDDWGQRVAGLMQVDLLQAVSYLDAQPQIDAKRIGVVGYSMGAYIAGIEGSYDTRVHAVLLSGGGVIDDGTGGYFDTNHSICQSSPWHALAPLLTVDNKPARGSILYFLNNQRGPTFVMNGAEDTVMNIPRYNAAWFSETQAHAASFNSRVVPANVFSYVVYPGVSHRPSWVNRDGMHWLNAQLHFAFWKTDATIDSQGTTHVSSWLTANHVDISPNYFREDREGGIEAVGMGFPGVSRADLMVLPDADFDRLKDQLTYEAWAAKATAAEQFAANRAKATPATPVQ